MSRLAKRGSQMAAFWDQKAREDARFYIATWLGYKQPRSDSFFLSGDQVLGLLREHGYQVQAGSGMLEIGCGIGRMTRGFSELFASVDAIDVSPEMVRQARANLAAAPNVRVHLTDGVSLSLFANETFDFCFSFIVFQHFPEFAITRSYLLEAARVLKPGGTLLFQVNNLPAPTPYRWAPLRLLSTLWRRYGRHALLELHAWVTRGPRGFDHPAWIGHSVQLAELEEALAAAGLDIVSMRGQRTPYLWVHALRREAACG